MRLSLLILLSLTSMPMACAADDAANTLTAAEKADGWQLLFDGKSLDQWRGYKKEGLPGGWKVQEDGTLARVGGGGDLISKEQFASFELQLEWKISEGGNSGFFYRATEAHNAIYESAPEMQVLDNQKHGDGKNPKTSSGANYALIACPKDVTKPVGDWNAVRLIIKGNHVEHWLNGEQMLAYELGSPEWVELVKKSKFANWPDYGKAAIGHIGLQDHGNLVWYRNIKLRALTP